MLFALALMAHKAFLCRFIRRERERAEKAKRLLLWEDFFDKYLIFSPL
jgi:hypothetical protein